MTVKTVDLALPVFWLFLVAGTVLLTPLVRAGIRKILLAVINLAFLWALMGHWLAVVVAALVVFYGVLRLASSSGGAKVTGIAAGLGGATLLFVVHKLPVVGERLHLARVHPVLVAVGYSYVFLRSIDVLRATWEGRTAPPGMVALVNYLLPFHMLAAGPIQAWDDFAGQPEIPEALTLVQSLSMIERIVQGLFKKYVLAMAVSSMFLTQGRVGGWYRIVEMNMDYVWLYLDFSAYSDIAVGAGGLLGVATPENFIRPYLARNITDYWERWHITLSMWVRRNLFFPLQISLMRRTEGRHGLWCASLAIFVSFMLCGAWHGLTPPFLWWGFFNASGLIVANLYRYWLKKRLGTKGVARYMASGPIRVAAMVVTFEFVAFTIMLIASK